MRRDAQRLRDVLEAVAAIERHTAGGRPAFDAQVWNAVDHNLPALKHAAARLLTELGDT